MGTIKEKTMKVLSFDDIPLHDISVEFLEKVFTQYTFIDQNDKQIFNDPIVHLYPVEDTRDSDGILNGYGDALFFEAKIYDPTKSVYTTTKSNDAVDTSRSEISSVRIFKDGSTLIEFSGKYKFSSLTSLIAYKVKETADFDYGGSISPVY